MRRTVPLVCNIDVELWNKSEDGAGLLKKVVTASVEPEFYPKASESVIT